MRVIAGRCRSMPLSSLPGKNTRPTTDRIKETLFNMISPYVPGSRMLDLFAGTGGIGIEALSRGASFCVFADINPKAVRVIRDNLRFTKLEAYSAVYQGDAKRVLHQLMDQREAPFDLIFLDPPYLQGMEKEVLQTLEHSDLIHEDTLIILEASCEDSPDYLQEVHFVVEKIKKYKTNMHLFLHVEEK